MKIRAMNISFWEKQIETIESSSTSNYCSERALMFPALLSTVTIVLREPRETPPPATSLPVVHQLLIA
jgi:hypothetical protein